MMARLPEYVNNNMSPLQFQICTNMYTYHYKYVYISLQDTVCVKFTPKQYLKLYECGLLYCNGTKLNTDAAVIKSLKDDLKTWLDDIGFGNTTTNGGIPEHDCQLVK